jgi:hypothetical protein
MPSVSCDVSLSVSTIPSPVLTSLTSSENQEFVIKDIVSAQFKYYIIFIAL